MKCAGFDPIQALCKLNILLCKWQATIMQCSQLPAAHISIARNRLVPRDVRNLCQSPLKKSPITPRMTFSRLGLIVEPDDISAVTILANARSPVYATYTSLSSGFQTKCINPNNKGVMPSSLSCLYSTKSQYAGKYAICSAHTCVHSNAPPPLISRSDRGSVQNNRRRSCLSSSLTPGSIFHTR